MTSLSVIDQPLFAASGDSKTSLIPLNDEELLGLEGFLVDVIEELGSPWVEVPENFQHGPWLAHFFQVKRMCEVSAARNHGIYTLAQRRDEAFWRVPMGDIE